MIKNTEDKQKENVWSALGLAWQLGYTIAIPLVAFALGGRLFDKYLDTSPLLLLIGILVSIFVSSLLVYKKVAKILES